MTLKPNTAQWLRVYLSVAGLCAAIVGAWIVSPALALIAGGLVVAILFGAAAVLSRGQ